MAMEREVLEGAKWAGRLMRARRCLGGAAGSCRDLTMISIWGDTGWTSRQGRVVRQERAGEENDVKVGDEGEVEVEGESGERGAVDGEEGVKVEEGDKDAVEVKADKIMGLARRSRLDGTTMARATNTSSIHPRKCRCSTGPRTRHTSPSRSRLVVSKDSPRNRSNRRFPRSNHSRNRCSNSRSTSSRTHNHPTYSRNNTSNPRRNNTLHRPVWSRRTRITHISRLPRLASPSTHDSPPTGNTTRRHCTTINIRSRYTHMPMV